MERGRNNRGGGGRRGPGGGRGGPGGGRGGSGGGRGRSGEDSGGSHGGRGGYGDRRGDGRSGAQLGSNTPPARSRGSPEAHRGRGRDQKNQMWLPKSPDQGGESQTEINRPDAQPEVQGGLGGGYGRGREGVSRGAQPRRGKQLPAHRREVQGDRGSGGGGYGSGTGGYQVFSGGPVRQPQTPPVQVGHQYVGETGDRRGATNSGAGRVGQSQTTTPPPSPHVPHRVVTGISIYLFL